MCAYVCAFLCDGGGGSGGQRSPSGVVSQKLFILCLRQGLSFRVYGLALAGGH